MTGGDLYLHLCWAINALPTGSEVSSFATCTLPDGRVADLVRESRLNAQGVKRDAFRWVVRA